MTEYKRSRRTPYLRDDNIKAMVARLSRGEITDEKVEWVARAVHKLVGWAGTPVAWDNDGQYWNQAGRDRALAEAREVLLEAKLDNETKDE